MIQTSLRALSLLLATMVLGGCAVVPKTTHSPISLILSTSTMQRLPTVTPDPIISPVIISEVIRKKDNVEIIVLINISQFDQNISGMSLIDPKTMSYMFLPEIVLPPKGIFKVCNGNCEVADGMSWLEQPVLREPGDQLILLNRAGRVVWNYVNYP